VHGHTYSDLDFKVVLEDQARSAYTGLIRIELDASDSEAYQENRNLLLDKDCRAESIPELEILNQDVRCTHGATVGPIDDEQIFYLMTRGLPRREAERAIVEGFFAPVLDRIDEESLKGRLWSYIRSKLEAR
jgi:Fe-S cluster assembly protein SufD